VLATGERLPTVRELATRLGTSPATVNSAYRILGRRGLAIGEGRRGTRVAPRPAVRTPDRGAAADAAGGRRDLSIGLPDPALLPAIAPVLERVEIERKLRLSGLDGPDPELIELARAAFSADGLRAGAIAVTSGAFDGIERVLQAHLRPGDRVILDDPMYVANRDLLLALGLTAVPVPVDDAGMLPDRFAAALRRGADAVVLVPRAQNPFGSALDPERAGELQRALEPSPDVLIVEDDHAGPVSGAPFSTLVTAASNRWAVVRSTSKFLHPDLRLALVAGDETTIARVEGYQALGPRWVSHILQALVVGLLRDPGYDQLVTRAREAYVRRREALIEALAAHGLQAHGRSGLNVWIPVRQEAPVIQALYDAGWIAAAGEAFRIQSPPAVRITIATLTDDEPAQLARIVAAVEHGGRPRGAY
jgi:DNA-binding transcriptional MocR family regulator